MRTSSSQFQLLVDFMQANGDLSRPTEGPHGRQTNQRMWSELTELLNADATGDTKTVEKWRKVWSDFKNNTKKKAARLYRSARGTGGGPASSTKLSDLEQRVLSIMGTRAATGIVEIPEVGLEDEMTVLNESAVETVESPTIFLLHERFQQTCSTPEDWNRPGTSAQPTVCPPREVPEVVTQDQVPRISPGAGVRQHVSQSPTPLPPTPRRHRRRPMAASPLRRNTRTQTQSDLARQAFVRSDTEWRAFQQQAQRETNRLRELEIRNQERWLDLFGQFLALGNRIVDTLEKR